MSCKCGGGCGPIIVQPEIVLPDQSPGDITVDVTDHELEVLCDATGTPFLRRYSVDPDGTVTTVDTDLDGTTTYTATAPIGVCGPDAEASPAEECGTTVVVPLCDRTEESPGELVIVRFLRRLTFDCDGAIASTEDLDVDGNPYTLVGEVGSCEPETSTCGLPDDAITEGETNSGAPGELQAVDTPSNGRIPPGRDPGRRADLTGGAQSLWDGGSVVYPADPDASATDGLQVYRQAQAILTAERPVCDSGTALVTASVRVTNDGPNRAAWYAGTFSLYDGTTTVALTEVDKQAPVGHTETLTLEAIVPAEALANGELAVQLELETWDVTVDGPGTEPKSWTADQFVATYEYDTEGCGEEQPSMAVRLCEPITINYKPEPQPQPPSGAVIEVCRCDDVDGDGVGEVEYVELWKFGGQEPEMVWAYLPDDPGTPYEPRNPAPCAADASDCATSSTSVVLCDSGSGPADPASVPLDTLADAPPTQSGTLANGVGYSVGNGTWNSGRSVYGIPLNETQTWTFDKPVDIDFDIAGLGNVEPSDTVCAVLPEGTIAVNIDPAHTWDAATRTVCGSGAPFGTSSFRLEGVTGLSWDATGNDASIRGVAAVTVTPLASEGGPFLRTYVSDCNGDVTQVKDTELDGQTPYVVGGTVSSC